MFFYADPFWERVFVAKPTFMVTRQRIFTLWGCVLAVKPSLVPVLRMTGQLGGWEGGFFPPLN